MTRLSHFLLATLFAAVAAAADPRLNFVFIIGDDISGEDFGCYGNPGIRTPNVDRLAAEGLRFTNAYVTTSSCSPSRCSILTSRYPHNLETASELHGILPEGVTMFPKLLRDAGYYTAQSGKSHFGTDSDIFNGPAVAAFDIGGDGARDDLSGGHGGENQWIARLRGRPMRSRSSCGSRRTTGTGRGTPIRLSALTARRMCACRLT